MRREFLKRFAGVAAAGLAVGLWVSAAWGQAAWPNNDARHMTRPQLWTSFRSNGSQGPKHWNWQSDNEQSAGLQYPGSDIASGGMDFPEYWGNLGGWTPAMQRQNATSRGEGVWIITKLPGEPHKFSLSGHRVASPDIAIMQFDPSQDDALKDLGNPSKAPRVSSGRVLETSVIPSGVEMSNWWPGQVTEPENNQPIEIHNYDWFRYMGQIAGRDNAAEEIIVSKWTTGNGVTGTRKAYGWGHPQFDDFFIVEYVFENTGDTNGDGAPDAGYPVTLNDTYFAFPASFKVSEATSVLGHHNRYYGDWGSETYDDWWRWTEAPNYLAPGAAPGWTAGRPSLVGKKMIYQFDGDTPSIPIDDTGGPFRSSFVNLNCAPGMVVGQLEDELLSYQFMGYAPLDIDPSDGFTGDPEMNYVAPRTGVAGQPYNVWRHESTFSGWASRTWSDAQMADEFLKPLNPLESYDTNEIIQSVCNEDMTQASFESGMMFGPYDLKPGDKAKIVLAFVGATAVQDDIWEWARTGAEDLAGTQQQLKDNGAAMLEEHLSRAQWVYDHGYDVPDQPPDVYPWVRVNTQGSADISWSDKAEQATHPDYTDAEAKDVAGYRVYRSNKGWKGHMGPWVLLADIPKGQDKQSPDYVSVYQGGVYTFTDLTAQAGFAYWYMVRTYAAPHSAWTGDVALNAQQGTFDNLPAGVRSALSTGLESALSPESKTMLELRPVLPGNAAADNLSLPVRAVPNPFKLDQVHAYGQTNNIRFTNIPRRARVSIFSISGDLITEIIHDDPTTSPAGVNNPSEVTWTQGSRSGLGVISPGMYFFVVENIETGNKAEGTFMIVR